MNYRPPITTFVLDFLKDPQLRARILHKEETTLKNEYPDLNSNQVELILRQDRQEILNAIMAELDALPLALMPHDPHPQAPPCPPQMSMLAAQAAYDEGKIFIRYNNPKVVRAGDTREVVCVGTGFDLTPVVTFRRTKTLLCADVAGEPPIPGQVLEVQCEVDAFQYVTVRVTLPTPGVYTIEAVNNAGEPVNMGMSGWIKAE